MFDNFLIFLHLNNQSYSLRTLFVFFKTCLIQASPKSYLKTKRELSVNFILVSLMSLIMIHVKCQYVYKLTDLSKDLDR